MASQNYKPLVSIITPFLNSERFFEECIESVLNQTYDNWELMLVDDGSKDKSAEIAKRYSGKYPDKIFYLEHPGHVNRGASASRNLGIQSSRGEYISFLDSDDIYLPKKLEDQVALFNKYPEAGMLYSSTEYWYSWTGLPEDAEKDWVWDTFGVAPNTVIAPPKLLTTYLRDGRTVPCMGSVLVRRKTMKEIGGWENSFTHIYTDQVFHAKICFNCPVIVVEGCWDRYRQHPDSSCHVVERTNKAYLARYNYLRWLRKYLLKNGGQQNSELWDAFTNAQRPFKYNHLKKLFSLKHIIVSRVKKALT